MNEISSKTDNTKRKKLFKLLALVFCALFLVYFLYYFFIGSNHVSTDNAYVGAETSQVSAAVGGIIKKINFTDTQEVKVDDVLVEIDDSDSKLSLAVAKANLAKAEAIMNQARSISKRRDALRKADSASEEEVINAKSDFKAAEASFDAAKAALEQANLDLQRTTIKAPINGVISRRQVQLGQRVQVGTLLLSIMPTDAVHVDANFKEVQLRKVKVGQDVKLTSDKYGSSVVYHGKVVGFSGGTGSAFAAIPAQNATGNWIKVVQRVPVRIELNAEELREHPLQIGLSMQVEVDVSK
jgi:membrane fusion protein (multidrug efflux system)